VSCCRRQPTRSRNGRLPQPPTLLHALDDFYEALIDTHRDLTLEQSQVVNAKLILLLANHIGDLDVLRDALKRARDGL
jgi:hypothetical protein